MGQREYQITEIFFKKQKNQKAFIFSIVLFAVYLNSSMDCNFLDKLKAIDQNHDRFAIEIEFDRNYVPSLRLSKT